MSPIRRLTALLASVLLLQLMLLGSGAFCGMHGGPSHGTRGMRDTAVGGAMHHAGAAHRAGATTAVATPGAGEQDTGGTCRGPWVPGACVSMVTCATVVATAPPRAVAAVEALTRVLAAREPAAARAGPTFAPELPPPRA